MGATVRRPLAEYLTLEYPFNVVVDPDGGYSVFFPDLPGCMTQVESLDELPAMALEARTLWIEVEYEQGHDIPLPSHPEEYSGKFNLRLPRSLHRSLVEAAQREGVSLNQYVVYLMSRRDGQAQLESRLDKLAEVLPALETAVEDMPTIAKRERARRFASQESASTSLASS